MSRKGETINNLFSMKNENEHIIRNTRKYSMPGRPCGGDSFINKLEIYSRFVNMLNARVAEFIRHLREEWLSSTEQKEKVFVFIDEIQYLADPSSFLKLVADHHKNIKLIVSGSSSFEIKSKFKNSLVGMTVNFEIFNLSFKEFLSFSGYVFEEGKVYTQKKTDELKALFKEYLLKSPSIIESVGRLKLATPFLTKNCQRKSILQVTHLLQGRKHPWMRY